MNRHLLILAFCALPPSLLSASSDTPKQQEVMSQLQQATAKANIFDLPAFSLKANVQVEVRGKMVDGTYQLLWNGPNQWKTQVTLPGYDEVQVGGKGTIWVRRSTEFIPSPIFNLYQALGFGSSSVPAGSSLVLLDFSQKDIVKKRRERKEHGDRLTCFETESEVRHAEFCLNDSTGTIVRSPSSFADDDLQPIGEKLFPRKVSYLLDRRLAATAVITEITIVSQFPPEAFNPPAGIAPQEGCMNPTPPHLIKKVAPEYPPNARAQRVQGTVRTDVVIGIDGVPRIRKVVESPSPDLESSSTRAIEGWRYDPATCSGTPVPVSTLLQVNYTLSY
jgi:TonB family protein